MLSRLKAQAMSGYFCAKSRLEDFINQEKGGSEIIAIVLVIGVVLVLAAVFWEQISTFFGGLISKMFGNAPSGDINKDNVRI